MNFPSFITRAAKSLSFSKTMKFSLFVSLWGLYFLTRMHSPISVVTSATADDAHFIYQGISIVNGQWLGAYNQWTLIKGSGLPLFLAFNGLIGIPLTLSVAIVYGLSAMFLSKQIGLLVDRQYVSYLALAFLLLNPYAVPTRVLRDITYAPLTLLVIGFCVLFIRHAILKRQIEWKTWLLFGLTFFAFWITREEGVWLVPTVVISLATFFFRTLRSPTKTFGGFVVGVLAFGLPFSAVSAMNFLAYKVPVGQEFTQGSFSTAVTKLSSVQEGPDISFVPASKKVRSAISKYIPEFAEMDSYMLSTGKTWEEPGCTLMPATCGEIAGGWLPFALRDAAASIGVYSDGENAEIFWSSISREIEDLCLKGSLTCKTSPIPYMSAFTQDQIKQIPGVFTNGLGLALGGAKLAPSIPSEPPVSILNSMKYFLGNPKATSYIGEDLTTISGWFASEDSDWINVTCPSNQGIQTVIKRNSSVGLKPPGFSGVFDNNRFTVEVPIDQDCVLKNDNGAEIIRFDSTNGSVLAGGHPGQGSLLWIDAVSQSKKWDQDLSRLLLEASRSAFNVCTWLFPFAVIAFFTRLFLHLRKGMRLNWSLDVATAIVLIALFARLSVLTVISVSSFPAFSADYLSPAFQLAQVFILLSLVSCLDLFKSIRASEFLSKNT